MAKQIWTTTKDKERLLACLELMELDSGHRERPHIQELSVELERAEVVEDPSKTPEDLITMRSQVELKNLSTGRPLLCTLVYPEEGNPEEARISVLAPLGTAMLGHRVGDTFEVRLPKGPTTFEVARLAYQPEMAGDFHL